MEHDAFNFLIMRHVCGRTGSNSENPRRTPREAGRVLGNRDIRSPCRHTYTQAPLMRNAINNLEYYVTRVIATCVKFRRRIPSPLPIFPRRSQGSSKVAGASARHREESRDARKTLLTSALVQSHSQLSPASHSIPLYASDTVGWRNISRRFLPPGLLAKTDRCAIISRSSRRRAKERCARGRKLLSFAVHCPRSSLSITSARTSRSCQQSCDGE